MNKLILYCHLSFFSLFLTHSQTLRHRHTHTEAEAAWTRPIPTLHILASVCVLKCIVVFSHTSPFDVSFVTVNKRRLMNEGDDCSSF